MNGLTDPLSKLTFKEHSINFHVSISKNELFEEGKVGEEGRKKIENVCPRIS
jgi:hypothetical protein